jgi:bacterioferritin-associated ferredoxin
MLVCHCRNVSDRQIRAAVRSGARTRGQIARACQAGSRCGGCTEAVDQILEAELESGLEIRLISVTAFSAAAG